MAWQRLVRLYSPLAYRWCRAAEDSADVLQNVFQSVWLSIGRFRREDRADTFRGWLWVITRNKVHDFYRSHDARAAGGTSVQERLAQLPAEPPELSGEELSERGRMLRTLLESLRGEFEDRTWTAFWRVVVEGHSAAEIASDLAMTTKAVRQAKYRVLKRCREELKGLWEL